MLVLSITNPRECVQTQTLTSVLLFMDCVTLCTSRALTLLRTPSWKTLFSSIFSVAGGRRLKFQALVPCITYWASIHAGSVTQRMPFFTCSRSKRSAGQQHRQGACPWWDGWSHITVLNYCVQSVKQTRILQNKGMTMLRAKGGGAVRVWTSLFGDACCRGAGRWPAVKHADNTHVSRSACHVRHGVVVTATFAGWVIPRQRRAIYLSCSPVTSTSASRSNSAAFFCMVSPMPSISLLTPEAQAGRFIAMYICQTRSEMCSSSRNNAPTPRLCLTVQAPWRAKGCS